MTYIEIAELTDYSVVTVRRCARELFPEKYIISHDGGKYLNREQSDKVIKILTNKICVNKSNVPIELIHKAWKLILEQGKLSKKECRKILNVGEWRDVCTLFETNEYHNERMLVYEDEPNQGANIYPLEVI